jgi:hypothetical protein
MNVNEIDSRPVERRGAIRSDSIKIRFDCDLMQIWYQFYQISNQLRFDSISIQFDFIQFNSIQFNSIQFAPPVGGVSLIVTFFERVAEVPDSPKYFKILRILLKYYHIIMTMGMY